MIDPFKMDALVSWLFAGAMPNTGFPDTLAELARRLIGAGLPLDTIEVYMKNISPLVLGSVVYWTKRKGTQIARLSHAEMQSNQYIGSVPQVVTDTGRTIRVRIGTGSPFDATVFVQAKHARGYTDYFMCPLFGRFVPTGAVAVATKQAGGFAEEDLTVIRSLQAPVARVVEAEVLHANVGTVLSTYVGRNAGEKVMDGRILRGYSENIAAVVLFADLKNFTALSNSLPPEETLALLNTYFEALDTAIRANGGETLKFIGDGLLAIFPTQDEPWAQTAAAMGAISALDDARINLAGLPNLSFRAALHVGDIHYGNIGSPTRLDFTAVGPSVNLTARMLQACTELDAQTVCSDAFAPLTHGRATPTRAFDFKGFDQAVMVHVVG